MAFFNIQDGPATHLLELSYEGEVDIQGLCGHTHLDLNYADDDLQSELRALNILVSKSFDELPVETLRDGANKSFVKSAYRDLGNGNLRFPKFSNSLCTLHGYSYTWVLEVSSPEHGSRGLLDVRRLILVLTAKGSSRPSSLHNALVKPIEGFGLQFAHQAFTMDEKKKTNVMEHFKEKWYPSEYLQLLPYENFKGLVPDKVAGGMLKTACQRPPEAKALIALESIEPWVKTTELPKIEKASIDAVHSLRKEGNVEDNDIMRTVNITAKVCVKRHSVRFYSLPNDADKNLNCPSGTQVESVVTCPFFHAAIKGTAKPCHHLILRNDLTTSMPNPRTHTHKPRYTSVRAPCSASYS
ncbi:hypothetical protein BDU57DRAFT_537919 [Ampelomyces quisqualis]|uniref:Uncharacterized protein n=1 Tax=Ampelomyces quisqualis TaxID=50730 RepID=A0A6A5QRP4_AMPQU|nr:hypothetical protein BDU57DRAFT_537919 [Ampelomyces quisqualis]